MTSGYLMTSQIFVAYANKLIIPSIYGMPDSGIQGKSTFDSMVTRENQQLISKIMIPARSE